MISEIYRHLRYFTPRLIGFGLVLGGLFGALTYPILGAAIGAPWGLVGGLVVALLLSIFIPIYERRFNTEDEASRQAQLTMAAGLVTTLVMALPLLILYAPIAGLTAAYLVHEYAESAEFKGEKRKSSIQDPYQRRSGVFTKVASEMMNQSKWVIGLCTVVGILLAIAYGMVDPFIPASTVIFGAPFFGIGALIYGFLAAIPVAFVNGLFVNFMNRLYFDAEMPKELYKRRIVPMVTLLTLFTSAVVTFGLGAPFAAVAAGIAAAKYADWYYEDDGEEKAKRGARLEDSLDDGEADLDDAEAVESLSKL